MPLPQQPGWPWSPSHGDSDSEFHNLSTHSVRLCRALAYRDALSKTRSLESMQKARGMYCFCALGSSQPEGQAATLAAHSTSFYMVSRGGIQHQQLGTIGPVEQCAL